MISASGSFLPKRTQFHSQSPRRSFANPTTTCWARLFSGDIADFAESGGTWGLCERLCARASNSSRCLLAASSARCSRFNSRICSAIGGGGLKSTVLVVPGLDGSIDFKRDSRKLDILNQCD
jgi:hypothetical protein